MNWTQALNDFKYFLKIERGLSENSVQAYGRDLQKFANFQEESTNNKGPITVTEEDVREFIYRIEPDISARSQARLISGLRSFFDYLIFEDYRSDNPLDLVESPKLGRKLPDTLSEEDIDRIFAQIDRSTPEGERNRAMLETLYSCGLRVSEMVGLKISDLFFEEGFIRVIGKGNKQRFVPVNDHIIRLIDNYRNLIRSGLKVDRDYEDTLFLNRRGRQLSRNMVFMILKDLVQKAGIKKK